MLDAMHQAIEMAATGENKQKLRCPFLSAKSNQTLRLLSTLFSNLW